nr:MAG TPA: hypothetical protein [Caudoviricetes sp.]
MPREPLVRQPGSCFRSGVWRRLGSHWVPSVLVGRLRHLIN